MEGKIEEILKQLKEMREEIQTVKTLVETNSRLELLFNQVKVLETKFESMSAEIEQIQKENNEIKWKIKQMERYSRSNNLIINGMPEQEGENLYKLMSELAEKLKLPLNENEIDTLQHLPSKTN